MAHYSKEAEADLTVCRCHRVEKVWECQRPQSKDPEEECVEEPKDGGGGLKVVDTGQVDGPDGFSDVKGCGDSRGYSHEKIEILSKPLRQGSEWDLRRDTVRCKERRESD